MSKQVTVKISQTGEAQIEAEGFVGGACKTATAPIEALFDGAGANVVEKPEMYEQENEQHLGG